MLRYLTIKRLKIKYIYINFVFFDCGIFCLECLYFAKDNDIQSYTLNDIYTQTRHNFVNI